ncbi:unnamed protein product [Lasius platythorax]|uniref:Uncharacterized protein n=1 Tax=Lasius platythorax TaxID=488582 RepID=A0AAV2NWF1_9HYME
MRSAMQLHPAGRRPTAKGEAKGGKKGKNTAHKRLQYTESRAPVQLQRSTYRRCNGVDVIRADAGAAQTVARYVKVGHPARTTAPPPLPLLVSCR